MRWRNCGPWFVAAAFTAAAFTGLRKPIAVVNRWVADAIDPQRPVLSPPPICTLQGSHDGISWQTLAQWPAVRVASSDGAITAVRSPAPLKCSYTRFAELTQWPFDSRSIIVEESRDAWIGTWRPAIRTHLRTSLEDARHQIEQRGFKCGETYVGGGDGPRRINCRRGDTL
jgi:hypothetical protein